jgi:hypothetical protein
MGPACLSPGWFLQWLVRHLGLPRKVREVLFETYVTISMILIFIESAYLGRLLKINGCVGSNKMNKTFQERDELIPDFWYRIGQINLVWQHG